MHLLVLVKYSWFSSWSTSSVLGVLGLAILLVVLPFILALASTGIITIRKFQAMILVMLLPFKIPSFYMTSSALLTSANVNSSGILHTVSDSFVWTAALIRGTGAIMGVTVIPLAPLSSIQMTCLFHSLENVKYQFYWSPILLRYAPQMNGNWLPWTGSRAYRESFVKLANMVHNTTNNTAMVWSPVSALSYPFPDDPFLPYYPGDDAVDWAEYLHFTSSNPARSFYPIPAGMPYPFPPVSQTANTTSAAPSDVKAISFQLLMNQVKYPLIRAIVMFNKIVPLQATSLYLGKSTFSESLHSTAVADFTLTENSQVLQAFNMDLLPLILLPMLPWIPIVL
ncbi:hypothetical protein BSLG_005784 [Batrachochytrium salamandrivorans]|nr:hypothetical protein BSLG_005784 [Batrachochytrium salamandrivorans]